MKKEYQYLIGGALISAAVLLGMGSVGAEKQTTEGRYQFIPHTNIFTAATEAPFGDRLFAVMDSQTGTVSYVDRLGRVFVLPFAATKAE